MIKKIIAYPKNIRNRLFEMSIPASNEPMQSNLCPTILFSLTIFFYILYQLAMQPGWVLGGEMWAEMATNYFPNANSPSYLQKLFSTDSGYIPAPQRLIAFVGNQLNLPAASVPYFYTWSAIIFTAMMVGTFCLAQFRILVKSDLLRFLTAISILMVADFETRTFINFTYFSAFFVAIVTALALVDDSEDIPWWAWFVPILMVSKPAVLAALPAMILVAMVSKSRFRWITIIVVALCIGQILQMVTSAQTGMMPFRINEITFASKVIASFRYFLGFLGGYVIGQTPQLTTYFLMLAGLFVVSVSGFAIFNRKSKAGALIIIGLSLLFFNVLLNAFALSDLWNLDMTRLDGIPVYRHIVVGFSGCIMVASGLFSALTHQKTSKPSGHFRKNLGALLFFVWFTGSGWLSFAGKISREPRSPTINNSQWQNMAVAIDSGISPVCVPIDPWWKGTSWMYQRNCSVLKPAPAWEDGLVLISNPLFFDLTPPSAISDKTLIAAAILVKPFSTQKAFIEVQMLIKLVDGNVMYYAGARNLNSSGGLLLLTGKESIAIKNISSVRLIFNVPVEIALAANDPTGVPGIAWMGN
ncbi:hypothetical protein [Solimicrobium silvestre]|uniref:Uncharacterized protein n=1 Tax=Solimicrobium silvestre TaxID=2099400 RepID=A0A2S9H1Z3_9BURK|nr:hypothetical protein [Solimicrobium silvestre]PRC93977.1 hypothetical protein S2091_1150 [Solimicrobium silvestre]